MDIELLISIVGAVFGAWGIFREAKYRQMRTQFLAVLGGTADGLAYIYDRAQDEKLCDAETLATIADKAGKIWTDLGTLGVSVEALLQEKSSLAEALKKG